MVDERVDVEPELGDLGRHRAERVGERLRVRPRVDEDERAPGVDGDGHEAELVAAGSRGSSSARGAARRQPSSPYVHAWYGHWSVSRAALALGDREAAVAADVEERAEDAVAGARDDDRASARRAR